MFLEYYGLRDHPFGVTPDPRYLYLGATHREALASLFYGIETGCGFLTLIATPGMGKTTLLLHLLERLRGSAQTAFLFQTQCTSREFFRYLLLDLGMDAEEKDLSQMHQSLNIFLLNNARTGRRFVMVIDEAQNLEDSVLETVRLLSDFEAPPKKLLQIILCGQPQLADRLSKPGLMQLRQRISIVSRLRPFSLVETMAYVEHRLHVAGYIGSPLFQYEAISQIAKHSGGIPRNINNICFNSLTLGFAKQQKRIDAATVKEILEDLNLDSLGSSSPLHELPVIGESAPDDQEPASLKISSGEMYSRFPLAGSDSNAGEDHQDRRTARNPETVAESHLTEDISVTVFAAETTESGRIGGTEPDLIPTTAFSDGPLAIERDTLQESTHPDLQAFSERREDEEYESVVRDTGSVTFDEPSSIESRSPVLFEIPGTQSEKTVEESVVGTSDLAVVSAESATRPQPSDGHFLVAGKRYWRSIAAGLAVSFVCVAPFLRWKPQGKQAKSLSPVFAAQPVSKPVAVLQPEIVLHEGTPLEKPKIATKDPVKDSAKDGRRPAPPPEKPSNPGSDLTLSMFGALNAHPVAKVKDTTAANAPVVNPATNSNALLPPTIQSVPTAVDVTNSDAPFPSVGGPLQPPRLVSSVLPAFPEAAKNFANGGDVVVSIRVDEKGDISNMKVVSGPSLLRKAALDALSKWKYEPGKLGTEPVAMDVLVTIKFKR